MRETWRREVPSALPWRHRTTSILIQFKFCRLICYRAFKCLPLSDVDARRGRTNKQNCYDVLSMICYRYMLKYSHDVDKYYNIYFEHVSFLSVTSNPLTRYIRSRSGEGRLFRTYLRIVTLYLNNSNAVYISI